MRFDFDAPVDRRNSLSYKWDIKEGELPMWVADMDFKTAPAVINAIKERAEHGIFGYNIVPEKWYDSYVNWWKNRHGFAMKKTSLIFSAGVVPTISSAVRKLTTPAEAVLIQTPVYNIFYNSILNNGRRVIESPLVYDGEGYSIDFKDLEEKLADSQTTLMILCNPHNPIGKIWNREELARIGELCKKHNVTVISDEIHCDITDPGCEYTPFAAVSDTCRDISVTCIAPTKCFNIAGIQTSAVYAENPLLYSRINRALNTDEVAEPNTFATVAAVAAFDKGGEWLDELREYIYDNKLFVKRYLEDEIPELKLTKSDATYLLWINCEAFGDSQAFAEFIRSKTGLYLSRGSQYGEAGRYFLRMNIACRRCIVEDGLHRLKKACREYRRV